MSCRLVGALLSRGDQDVNEPVTVHEVAHPRGELLLEKNADGFRHAGLGLLKERPSAVRGEQQELHDAARKDCRFSPTRHVLLEGVVRVEAQRDQPQLVGQGDTRVSHPTNTDAV